MEGIEKEIEKEKLDLEKKNVATDHRLFRDRWLSIKRILDTIYKQLSPLANDPQTISIDKDILPEEQKRLLSSVIERMHKDGIIDCHDLGMQVVVTSRLAREFSEGKDIIVKSRGAFEEYRGKISEFYNFIEKDGMERFPEIYKKVDAKTEGDNLMMRDIHNYGNFQLNNGNNNNGTAYSEESNSKSKFFWHILVPLVITVVGVLLTIYLKAE